MGIRTWWQRRQLDEADFEQEVRAHLAIAEEERVADGLDPRSARYAALKEFGNVTRTREAARRVWTPGWLDALRGYASDVRYAVRALARTPVFSLTVVGVLTLGIGLNAAVFTMLKAAFLSPVAGVEGSARLAVIHGETAAGRHVYLSYPDYRHMRDHNRAFSGLFGTVIARTNLGRGRAARQVWTEMVTGNYFQALGIGAQLGRTLLPSDELAPGAHPVVVISDALWRRQFGADPGIVGRTIEVNNDPLTIVGVASSSFHGTTVVYDVELYIPVMMAPDLGFTFSSGETTPSGILSDRSAAVLMPQGFLAPGATLAHAAAQTAAIWATAARDRPLTDAIARVRVVPFWQTPGGAPSYIMPTLTLLSAMGLLVLLIACANIAGLVLVRGVSRRGEIAVRLALGAARARVIRLLVIENLVLAIPGAALGMLLARQVLPVFVGYADMLANPDRLFFNVEVDGVVVAFTAIVACGCAMAFGVAPALQCSRVDLVAVIHEDASPRGAARGRFRSALVVAQVAVSLLLLVGAGLVTGSLDAARRADPGFDASGVTSLGLDLKQNGYDPVRGRIFYRKLLDAARADGAVEFATLAGHHPMGMQETRAHRMAVEGYEPRQDEDLAFMTNTIGPDYFRTLRIPLVAGRGFEDGDDETSAPVAIVNTTFAATFWGSAARAIGQRVRLLTGEWRTVVGVAADVKYARIDEPARPYVYLPFPQAYQSSMILHTRAKASGADALQHVVERTRGYVTALDGDLPIMYAKPMADRLRGAFIFLNLAAMMLFIFGWAGMLLAAMGTYGLVSYTVRQRTHEIGIRIALGASGAAVVREFLGGGIRLGVTGAALGIVAALGVSRMLDSMLFGVSPTDGTSYARALAIVLVGVMFATVVPAWRAARTNPLQALRHH